MTDKHKRAHSPQTKLILDLIEHHPEGLTGYSLQMQSGLRSGTVYPILHRLTKQGLLRCKHFENQIGQNCYLYTINREKKDA